MRSSNETYETVAKNCSAYAPNSSCKNKASNSASEHGRSCTNCRHFNKTGAYCELDLYDKIVEDHGLTK